MQQPSNQPDAGYQRLAKAILTVLAWKPPASAPKGEKGEAGLRDAAAKAWIYLALKAGGFERTIYTSNASLGAAIGGGHQKGERALFALLGQGLIEMPPGRHRGEFPVFLCDPQVAAIARQTRAESGSDQGELPFPDDPNSRPEGGGGAGGATLPLPPARAKAPDQRTDPAPDKASDPALPYRPSSEGARKTFPIDHTLTHGRWENAGSGRSSGAGSEVSSGKGHSSIDPSQERAAIRRIAEIHVQKSTEPKTPNAIPVLQGALSEAVTDLTERLNAPPGSESLRIASWCKYLTDRINDSQLGKFKDGRTSQTAEQMVRRIAWAMEERELYQRHLDEAFAALEYYCRRERVRSRAAFFFGVMKRIFGERKLEWGIASLDQKSSDQSPRR